MNCYYISTSGDDSWNGITPDTPWQSLPRLYRAFKYGQIVCPASILFRRGDVWDVHDQNRVTVFNVETSRDKQLAIGAYGTGKLPQFAQSQKMYSAFLSSYDAGHVVVADLDIRAGIQSIYLDGVSNWKIQRCKSGGAGNEYGSIMLRNFRNGVIADCIIDARDRSPVYLGHATQPGNVVENLLVRGNAISGCHKLVNMKPGCRGVVVHDNNLTGMEPGQEECIGIRGMQNVVAGNHIMTMGMYGVATWDYDGIGGGNIICDNTVIGATERGISLGASSPDTAYGNTIVRNRIGLWIWQWANVYDNEFEYCDYDIVLKQ